MKATGDDGACQRITQMKQKLPAALGKSECYAARGSHHRVNTRYLDSEVGMTLETQRRTLVRGDLSVQCVDRAVALIAQPEVVSLLQFDLLGCLRGSERDVALIATIRTPLHVTDVSSAGGTSRSSPL
jgi:hypothetical protein